MLLPNVKETIKFSAAITHIMLWGGLAGYILGVNVSRAQPAPPPQQQQSPSERALGNKLMTEINAGLQCSAQLVGAANQIAALEKELAEEKAKNAKPALEKPK